MRGGEGPESPHFIDGAFGSPFPLDKTESIIYLRNLKYLSLLQLLPVRLFGTGQAAHIHEEKNREGVILLKLGKFTTGNWEGL